PDARTGSKLREMCLSLILGELCGLFLLYPILLRESDVHRTSGLMLLRARGRDPVRVDITQSHRRLGAIQFRIVRGRQQDLSVLSEKLDRLFVPKEAQRAGEFLSRDDLQGAVQREKAGVAAKINAASD